jgi:hypothetical protein
MEADKNNNLSNKPVGIVVKTASPLSFDVLLDESLLYNLMMCWCANPLLKDTTKI